MKAVHQKGVPSAGVAGQTVELGYDYVAFNATDVLKGGLKIGAVIGAGELNFGNKESDAANRKWTPA